MTERPISGGRWIRDPATGALTPQTEAVPVEQQHPLPAVQIEPEAGMPAAETEIAETEAEALPARRPKKGN